MKQSKTDADRSHADFVRHLHRHAINGLRKGIVEGHDGFPTDVSWRRTLDAVTEGCAAMSFKSVIKTSGHGLMGAEVVEMLGVAIALENSGFGKRR